MNIYEPCLLNYRTSAASGKQKAWCNRTFFEAITCYYFLEVNHAPMTGKENNKCSKKKQDNIKFFCRVSRKSWHRNLCYDKRRVWTCIFTAYFNFWVV